MSVGVFGFLAGFEHHNAWTLRDDERLQKTSAYLQFLFQRFVLPATSTMTTEVDLMKHTKQAALSTHS